MRRLLLTLAVILLLALGWNGFIRLITPPYDAAWIASTYERKETAAAEIEGPKIVLIGGSSTHFGFSGETISRLIGVPVVNLGVHAGLGADYILDRAKRSLKRGDTAVLSLEYHLFKRARPSDVAGSFVAMFDSGYMAECPPKDIPQFVYGFSPKHLISTYFQRLIPWTLPLYRAETVTASGDETAGADADITPRMRALARSYPPISVSAPESHNPIQAIVDFVNWARANGVNVKYVWPPMIDRAAYSEMRYLVLFSAIRDTFKGLGVPVLGDSSDFFLREDEVLDTFYHANLAGRTRMSRRLAQLL
ncbi:hypothetical protein [Bradyrhizobium sp. USDA 241]|uniref:hypothetical protein n=1 Tax=Bradyrhizobium sp. USDA 241 TaxID=3377725 RepID=UPI003C76858F